MIPLDNAGGRKLQVITAQNGVNVIVGFSDYTTTTGAYARGVPTGTLITSGTTTDVCATPSADTIRDIDFISVKNTYAGSHAITVQIASTAGGPFILIKATLLADECLVYTHGSGFATFDASGQAKVTLTGTAGAFSVGGALTVTGAATVGGTFDVAGNFSVATSKLTVNATTGAAVFAGAVSLSNGTVAAPSANVGDASTGFYRVAANQLGYSANGALAWYGTAAGEMRMPLQPCFLAYKSSTTTDQTGDGTTYAVVCDTEIIDANADYDASTGVFTAPVTGKYLLQFQMIMSGLATGHTPHTLMLTTSNRQYLSEDTFVSNPFAQRTMSISVIADMDAGDTATFKIQVGGSTKVVDIVGAATPDTFISGMLVA